MDENLGLYQGEVKWFNKKSRYGFLTMSGGKEIWFHFGDGRFPEIKDHNSGYGEATIPWLKGSRLPLPDPEPGDVLIFEIGTGKKGPKAQPWMYQWMLVNAWLRYEADEEKCPNCPHKMGEHPGGYCIHGCGCGYDDDWSVNDNEANVGGHPGGFRVYE